jgi:hypothetical protein
MMNLQLPDESLRSRRELDNIVAVNRTRSQPRTRTLREILHVIRRASTGAATRSSRRRASPSLVIFRGKLLQFVSFAFEIFGHP